MQSRAVGRIMMAMSIGAFFVGAMGLWSSQTTIERGPAKTIKVDDRVSAAISRHMQDTHLKETMMKRKFEWENRVTAPSKLGGSVDQLPDDNRTYGVQLDQEDTSERLFEELNGNKGTYGDKLDEKINERLANRKWLNQQEKAERIVFIKNFIRTAYDRGFEVQLDANLVVTGVKPIHHPKQVNIEQVLERIAKQGQ